MDKTEEYLLDSPYTYIDDIPLEPIQNEYQEETDVVKMFRDKEYGLVEYLVLEALYRYPYLNKYNITKYLDSKLREKKWKDYKNVIKRLLKDNVIQAYSYASTRIYYLCDYTRNYMLKERHLNRKPEVMLPGINNKGEILECAALAQWHLALLSDERARKGSFYQVKRISKADCFLPSFVEVKNGKLLYQVLSFALPKGAANIKDFVKELVYVWSLMKKHTSNTRVAITVIVVSSIKDIENFANIMRACEDLSGRTLYFALEGNAIEFDGLNYLYCYDVDSNKEKLKTVCIK